MLILSFFITCPTKMVIKSGFEGFFRVKKARGKRTMILSPKNGVSGLILDFRKLAKFDVFFRC